MPIVRVEIVDAPGWSRPTDLARHIADATADALGSSPQSVWVRLTTIARDDYAENGGSPADPAPVIVSILEKAPPEGAALAAQVAALTTAIARACARNQDEIHLIYDPPGRDRVAFGGRIVT